MFALSASHPAFWEEVGDPMVSSSVSLDSSAPSDTLSEEGEGPSIARLQEAVQVLIEGVGEQLGREGLRDTPKRVAKAWLDVSSGYRQDVSSVVGKAIFHEPILTQAPTGVVIVRDVEFASTSEHDLLPFYGRLHIAYIPSNGVVLGLSKVARLAKLFARRLQTQERFTRELLESFQAEVLPQGAALIVEALHLSEGPASTKRLMSACAGCFQDKRSSLMQEFLLLLRLDAPVIVDVTRHSNAGSLPAVLSLQDDQSRAIASSLGAGKLRSGAASAAVDESGLGRMQRAVEVILREIGEDPSRRELRGSARRYVQRLLRSTSGYRQQLPSAQRT
ncbi:hypothetical protein WJX72_004538 [[Myrmecia] bisecta]|uniref:GTP cyclohydrolase 1 n=1 Tax=[Myrmecia] bisecta TaxID=41462 RepID=A0AAW1R7A0_9CHLO